MNDGDDDGNSAIVIDRTGIKVTNRDSGCKISDRLKRRKTI